MSPGTPLNSGGGVNTEPAAHTGDHGQWLPLVAPLSGLGIDGHAGNGISRIDLSRSVLGFKSELP